MVLLVRLACSDSHVREDTFFIVERYAPGWAETVGLGSVNTETWTTSSAQRFIACHHETARRFEMVLPDASIVPRAERSPRPGQC